MKRNTLYLIILFTWWSIILLSSYEFLHVLFDALRIRMSLFLILLFSAGFSIFFLLNYIRDIIFSIYYYKFYKGVRKPARRFRKRPLVEFLYYVHNDFNKNTFFSLLTQQYKKSRIVILDDSTHKHQKSKVSYYAKQYGADVVRRSDRSGMKAGSLNNYLKTSNANFFVVVDSRGSVHTDFVRNAIRYFGSKKVAAVQANHILTDSKDKLREYSSAGILSHSDVYQTIKNMYGFVSATTHGLIVRKEAFDKTGGFTYDVADDLLFSIALRKKGYVVQFAQDVWYFENQGYHCNKCKAQSCSWRVTNLLFLLSSLRTIMNSKMRWFEKLDIYLFLSSVPSALIYALYLINFLLMFTLINVSLHYTYELQIPLLAMLAIPLAIHAKYQLNQNREVIIAKANSGVDTTIKNYRRTKRLFSEVSDTIAVPLGAKRVYQKILAGAK